jgi:hypothetical protein
MTEHEPELFTEDEERTMQFNAILDELTPQQLYAELLGVGMTARNLKRNVGALRKAKREQDLDRLVKRLPQVDLLDLIEELAGKAAVSILYLARQIEQIEADLDDLVGDGSDENDFDDDNGEPGEELNISDGDLAVLVTAMEQYEAHKAIVNHLEQSKVESAEVQRSIDVFRNEIETFEKLLDETEGLREKIEAHRALLKSVSIEEDEGSFLIGCEPPGNGENSLGIPGLPEQVDEGDVEAGDAPVEQQQEAVADTTAAEADENSAHPGE